MKDIFILKYKRAFTLIELLVVISIIGLFFSIVFANLNATRDKANITAGVQFEATILHGTGDQLVGEWLMNSDPGNSGSAGTGIAKDTSGNNNGTVPAGIYVSNGGYNGKGTLQFSPSFGGVSLSPLTMPVLGKT